MFYTPKFCCECGDKIERDDWKFSTSRKFCENCETDYKFQKLIPASSIAVGLIGIIFGVGSYLKKPESSANLLTKTSVISVSNRNSNSPNQSNTQNPVSANDQLLLQKSEATNSNLSTSLPAAARKDLTSDQNSKQAKQDSAVEAVYICGAQTKKGTACMRRVKGGGRCWQHIGQPAILPPNKLIVSR